MVGFGKKERKKTSIDDRMWNFHKKKLNKARKEEKEKKKDSERERERNT